MLFQVILDLLGIKNFKCKVNQLVFEHEFLYILRSASGLLPCIYVPFTRDLQVWMRGFDSTQMALPSALEPFEGDIKKPCVNTGRNAARSEGTLDLPQHPLADCAPIQRSRQSINAACRQLLWVHPHKFVTLLTWNKIDSINIETGVVNQFGNTAHGTEQRLLRAHTEKSKH